MTNSLSLLKAPDIATKNIVTGMSQWLTKSVGTLALGHITIPLPTPEKKNTFVSIVYFDNRHRISNEERENQ